MLRLRLCQNLLFSIFSQILDFRGQLQIFLDFNLAVRLIIFLNIIQLDALPIVLEKCVY